jgi:hypothetical protein
MCEFSLDFECKNAILNKGNELMENKQEEHVVEDKNKRSSIFTVKDAENTILWFCFDVIVLIVCVILH